MSEVKKFCDFWSNGKFNHTWLDSIELTQVNSDTGRYYVTPEGNHYPSVTTILGKASEYKLKEWKESIGEDEAKRVSKRAATRGTTLHENAENYLLNHRIYIEKNRLIDISLFKGFKPILDRINNIKLLESPLYSHSLKMAGTVDCVAEFDGVLSVIDFKTTTKLKDKHDIDNYFIQTSIYSIMVHERYGLNIKNLVVLIANEFGLPQVFIENRKNWFLKIKELL